MIRESTKEETERKLRDFDRVASDRVNAIGREIFFPKRNMDLNQNQREVCKLI